MKFSALTSPLAATAIGLLLALPVFADDMYVDASTVRQVQRALHERGIRTGAIDGRMGPATQQAVRNFQRSESLEPTGQLNRQTLVALGIGHEQGADAHSYSAAMIRAVQKTLNDRGFHAGPANGMLSAETRAALKAFQKSENLEDSGQLNERTLAALGVSEATLAAAETRPAVLARGWHAVREAQRELRRHGYYAGPIDGVMGPATRAALVNFQRDRHLALSGQLDRATLAELGLGGVTVAEALPMTLTPPYRTVLEAQRALQLRGYYAGPIDGVMGPRTRAALRSFQYDKSLAMNGELDRSTLAALEVADALASSR